jgi:hypothetical protein
MACNVQTMRMIWTGYSAISTTEVFIPAGPWASAANVSGARGHGEMRGKTGNFQARPAVQVANDTRSPGTATAVGSGLAADGVSDPNGITALTTGSSKYIRPGWLVSLTSGTTLGTAQLGGAIDLIYG